MADDDNVVPFPSTPSRRFRVAKNKLSNYLFGAPEDDEPMHSPGPAHPGNKGLEKKQNVNINVGEDFWSKEPPIPVRRQDHFEDGTEEATIHHINEGKQIIFRREGIYKDPEIDLPYDQEKDPDK